MADPYSVLGVAKSADAEAIKRAYRKLAKELHPDRNKDNPKAVERFKAVSSAYELLSDAGKRAQYDRGEIDGEGNPKGFAPGGGFGGGFGGGGFRQRPGGFEFSGDPGDIFPSCSGSRAARSAARGSGSRRRKARIGPIDWRFPSSTRRWRGRSGSRWPMARPSISPFPRAWRTDRRCGWPARASRGRVVRVMPSSRWPSVRMRGSSAPATMCAWM